MSKTDKTETDNEVVKTPAFVPKIIKHVTLPTLKLAPNVPVYVKILEPLFDGKVSEKELKKDKDKKPPKIFNIVNLETFEPMQLVAGAVVVSEMSDSYPDDGYVGLCFMIEKGKKVDGGGGRGYFTYKIAQIEDPTPKEAAKK